MPRYFLAIALLLWMPVSATAKDVALVIGNVNYSDGPSNTAAARAMDAVIALEDAGFDVVSARDQNARRQVALARRFFERARDADRIVVFLAGHFAHAGGQSWLISLNADRPDLFSIGAEGLPLAPFFDLAKQHPGQAIVLLSPARRAMRVGAGLQSGLDQSLPPQGVTRLEGEADVLTRFLERDVLVPGNTLGTSLITTRDIKATGFIPRQIPFIPKVDATQTGEDAEDGFWKAVQGFGTVEAFGAYLDAYPDGRYSEDADREIEAIRIDPLRSARLAEEALNLNRDRRRNIQSDLSILGFDPRGIDGIFGSGTRAAISRWQNSQGFDETGFVIGNQITRLEAAADIRAAELEEEARRRREEQERLDASYWRQTGRNGGEDELRAYLSRYPDGLYSEIAQARLEVFEEERRQEAAAEERGFWDDVRSANTVAAYQKYLELYPDGTFAQDAKAKLSELEGNADRADVERDQRQEGNVANSPVARLLIENLLKAQRFDPGRVDGRFDENSRKAIRRFQRSRNLPATGYVGQATMVALLATR
jgi:peptidoglycan hydrolase-like protein with peptidoglycan-binding domain